MNAQAVTIPDGGDTSAGRRLSASLRELLTMLTRSGLFLLRVSPGPIQVPRQTAPAILRWRDLNRILLREDGVVLLPQIRPEDIGCPLHVVKLSAAFAATVIPTGYSMSQRETPRINDATTLTLSGAGFYTLITDGQNWFAGREP